MILQPSILPSSSTDLNSPAMMCWRRVVSDSTAASAIGDEWRTSDVEEGEETDECWWACAPLAFPTVVFPERVESCTSPVTCGEWPVAQCGSPVPTWPQIDRILRNSSDTAMLPWPRRHRNIIILSVTMHTMWTMGTMHAVTIAIAMSGIYVDISPLNCLWHPAALEQLAAVEVTVASLQHAARLHCWRTAQIAWIVGILNVGGPVCDSGQLYNW